MHGSPTACFALLCEHLTHILTFAWLFTLWCRRYDGNHATVGERKCYKPRSCISVLYHPRKKAVHLQCFHKLCSSLAFSPLPARAQCSHFNCPKYFIYMSMLPSHSYSSSPSHIQIPLHSVHLQLYSPPFILPPEKPSMAACCVGTAIIRGDVPPGQSLFFRSHEVKFQGTKSKRLFSFSGSLDSIPKRSIQAVSKMPWRGRSESPDDPDPSWGPTTRPVIYGEFEWDNWSTFASFSQSPDYGPNKIKWDCKPLLFYLAKRWVSP